MSKTKVPTSELFKGFSLIRIVDGKPLETLAAIHLDGRAYETVECQFDGVHFHKNRTWKKSNKTMHQFKALGFEFIGNYAEPRVEPCKP